MLILAIDTSCDETAAAVSRDDCILSNVISSQVSVHQQWGGVVPSLAKRKHQELIDHIVSLALQRARVEIDQIDGIAVTKGPGLAIALEVGIAKAKELAQKHDKPIIPINHMEGHIYSAFARNSKGNPNISYEFPLLAVLVSGGHTEIVLMENHGKYSILGKTLDDAIGETFDKVGRMLNMGYPAGPVIEHFASYGDENAYPLPIPMLHSDDLNMSFSGLKTACMKLINDELDVFNDYGKKFAEKLQSSKYYKSANSRTSKKNLNEIIADISASFQKAAIAQVVNKTAKAVQMHPSVKSIVLGGGVAQNKYLRKKLRSHLKNFRIFYPRLKKLFTDNAGMIAVAGFFNFKRGNVLYRDEFDLLDRDPNFSLDASQACKLW